MKPRPPGQEVERVLVLDLVHTDVWLHTEVQEYVRCVLPNERAL